jgi:hypothetical protein
MLLYALLSATDVHAPSGYRLPVKGEKRQRRVSVECTAAKKVEKNVRSRRDGLR